MSEDLFEKIIDREIPADIVWENDELLAFRDINPQAPVHVLIIPKRRIRTLNDLEDGDAELVGRMVLVAREIAASEGIAEDGYRLNFNCNEKRGSRCGISTCICWGGGKWTGPLAEKSPERYCATAWLRPPVLESSCTSMYIADSALRGSQPRGRSLRAPAIFPVAGCCEP